ncbi:hypothetical protein LCGC14_0164640 [marine sediment metagenome]|uniref:Uncharacterized protein n=1 Tax=marine sediment metagenome TaxID=412755 RepID=A0A0F9UUW2_9ZZZZ
MTSQHDVTTLLLEADATYSWLLPDGTILPVTGQRRHEAVAGDYYRERFNKDLEGGTYEDWAKAQGWARLVGTGFEAQTLTKDLLRRVQQTYLDAGVREMGTQFYIDISGPGGRGMQIFEVPYRDFLDIINPGELRRYKFESKQATLESKIQVRTLFGP